MLRTLGVNVSELGVTVHECTSISTIVELRKRKVKAKSERKACFVSSCFHEQTRVSQVGERSETLRVGCKDN